MKKILYIFLLLSLSSSNIFAQSLSSASRRTVNKLALELLDEYETVFNTKDKDFNEQFKRLFFSPDSKVVSDFYGDGKCFLDDVSLNYYCSFYNNNCGSQFIVISDVTKGGLFYVSNRLHYYIDFDKYFSYVDNNGVLFPLIPDSKPLRLRMHLIFNEDLSKCYIESISCIDANSNFKLNNYYVVLSEKKPGENKKRRFFEDSLYIEGEKLNFNFLNQAYASSLEYYHWNNNLRVKPQYILSSEEYDIVRFKYHLKNFQVRPIFLFALNPYIVDTGFNIASFDWQGISYRTGLDIGWSFSCENNTKFSLFSGVGYSRSLITLNSNVMPYIVNEGNFQSNYSLQYKQSLFTKDLVVPAYFEFGYGLGKHLYLMFNFGVNLYFNLESTQSDLYITGKYYSTDLSENSTALYVYRDYNISCSEQLQPGKSFSYLYIAGVSLDINLYKKNIYASLKLSYEFESQFYINNSQRSVFYRPSTNDYPLRRFVNLEDAVFYAEKSIFNSINLSRRRLWGGIGLIFKI